MLPERFDTFLREIIPICLNDCLSENNDDTDLKKVSIDELSNFQNVVVLTVSSHRFKIVTALHFENGGMLREGLIANVNHQHDRQNSDINVDDYLCEVLNKIVGKFKRFLQASEISLGMSVPSFLRSGCAEHIGGLDVSKTYHYKSTIFASAVLGFSFYVFVYGDFEFEVEGCIDDSSTGELEFF